MDNAGIDPDNTKKIIKRLDDDSIFITQLPQII